MNKMEVIAKVSEKSGVSINECQKVLDAFEEVLDSELSQSKNVSTALDKVVDVMTFLTKKKR